MRSIAPYFLVAGLGASLATTGCPAFPPDLCASGECLAATGDALDGGSTIVVNPACAALPADDPSVVRDECGVFVTPEGLDSSPGSKAAPVRSLARGLELAKLSQKRVYVCQGVYNEAVTIDAAFDGAQLLGGFDCASWRFDPTKQVVVSPSNGTPLSLRDVRTGVLFVELHLQAPPGREPGQSSVGVLSIDAGRVSFVGGSIAAGNGAPGVAGATPPATSALPVVPGGQTGSTSPILYTCPNGTGSSRGGGGGPGRASSGVNGESGAADPPAPPFPPQKTGAGGTAGDSCTTGIGVDGAWGPGGSGGAGAELPSAFIEGVLQPSRGADGAPGRVGQGGGGGASVDPNVGSSGSGGSGGAGGCGGAGGRGGLSGGSSIAVLAVRSTLTFASVAMQVGAGGAGGAGSRGEPGQEGGLGGRGGDGSLATSRRGCDAGSGGAGGGGGGGGGGAGGAAVGILWTGTTPPTLDGAPISGAATHPLVTLAAGAGAPGAGGPGGSPATLTPSIIGQPGENGKPGGAGRRAAVLKLP